MSSPTTLAVHRELAARLEQDDLVSNISPARTCSPTRKSYMLSVRGDRSRSEQGNCTSAQNVYYKHCIICY